MRVQVVRIGNSRGIRIPKSVLQECEIIDAVDLSTKGGRVILSPVRSVARESWEAAAVAMAAAGDDAPLLPDVLSDDEALPW